MNTIKDADDYKRFYDMSLNDKDAFWSEVAANYKWNKLWDKITSGDFNNLDVKWFEGAKLNITENCLDRHLESRGDKTAIIYEANNPNEKPLHISYKDLHKRVCQFSNVLKDQGVKKGDRVIFYMSMVPELLIGVLATARIGAIHSVVFGGFSANALAGRIQDCEATIIVTNDAGFRGDKTVPLKAITDEALKTCPTIKTVLVSKRVGEEVNMVEGRDHWLKPLLDEASPDCTPEYVDSEDPLFILYTSGSTGKPKGLLHTTAGYMVWAGETYKNVFQVGEDDVYWCTADIGWITGHSYITYGPLLNGSTQVMFEGVPTYPDAGRFWEATAKHKVTHFYTAPTAIRALEAHGLDFVKDHDLSSLKVLGSVGEPINEEAWDWYNKNIGKEKCPIVDTWWQTETGGIMISPLPGVGKFMPSFAESPLPGVDPIFVDAEGEEITGNPAEGNLCIRTPWPGMARTIWGDHERYRQTYFSTYPGLYFTGDGAKRNDQGDYRITGRVDDVINVSGHRMGTAEVEDALNQHVDIVESAVVGFPHDIKGQGIYAYVIWNPQSKNTQDPKQIHKELNDMVIKMIGPIAKPDKVQVVSGLPKTRSGKIMRRILRKVASGDTSNMGDISTLLNPEVVEEIKNGAL
ncbi:MAG: acetyl-CoA synthetase [Bacteriovoracaceae bacterium]|jgi:acetyl-CoA synthetase